MDSRRSSIPHFNCQNQQNAALICRTSTSYQFRRFYFQQLRKTNIVSSITKDLNPFHFHHTKPYKSNHHPTPIILSNNLQKKVNQRAIKQAGRAKQNGSSNGISRDCPWWIRRIAYIGSAKK